MACPHTKRAIAEKSIDTPIPYFRENRLSRLTVQDVEAMDEGTYAAYAFGWRRKEIMLRNLRLREGTHD
jgi:hypothetical protein